MPATAEDTIVSGFALSLQAQPMPMPAPVTADAIFPIISREEPATPGIQPAI